MPLYLPLALLSALLLLYFTILKCANDLNALYYLGIMYFKTWKKRVPMPKTKNTNCLLLYLNCCKYLE